MDGASVTGKGMNNPFDYIPDAACERANQELRDRLKALKRSVNPDDVNFCRELEAGKMLGVLIASDDSGRHHTLCAFSGQLGNGGFFYPGFVGPVFDYLDPDGYFKSKERDISRLSTEIAEFGKNTFSRAKREYEEAKRQSDAEIEAYKDKCRRSKTERDAKRATASCDEAELAAMIRQSQFEKAELHRLKKRAAERLEPLLAAMNEAQSHIDTLKERRRMDSEALQQWLFSNFTLLNA